MPVLPQSLAVSDAASAAQSSHQLSQRTEAAKETASQIWLRSTGQAHSRVLS